MDDDEDVHNQVCDTEDVWVVSFSLCPCEELHHAADPQELVETNLWVVTAEVEIEDVSRKHGDYIQTKLEAGNVSIPEELLVFHHQALLKVTCSQRGEREEKRSAISADSCYYCNNP